ncbi:MAG: hypothetical protein EPN98_21400 [Phenylobacterium sp.]|uniref:phage terminase large subunit n=1 Tax=Phenylobacterium sp. TaxID=1871053 RepID=UPI0011F6C6BD|nr:phage terminase large subunit [Phenylobacterium sp.]TAL29001.1 MAG: hypothetical protein EPN98_21400 [Phenylobacterium sp.]
MPADGRAKKEARLIELLRAQQLKTRLRDYIASVSPHLPPPPHLDPIIKRLEESTRRPIRLAISLPPRHAKTTLITHALAWRMEWSPADTHAYASYSDEQAADKSRIVRDLAIGSGVELRDDATRLKRWQTEQGGGLLAAGLLSGITGKGVNGLFVVDDPFKNRLEADSRTIRNRVYETFREVVMTRLEEVANSASVVVIHTRWHPDDLIGRLAKDGDFEILNIPALAEEDDVLGRQFGDALWEPMYSRAYLEALRVTMGAFSFDALYQGRPRPRGSKVFGAAHYYDPARLDLTGCRIVIGADPAASKKTTADYSAMGALAIRGRDPSTRTAYILEGYREQVTVPMFVADLRAFQDRHHDAEANVEGAGPGKAVVQTLKDVDPGIRCKESPTEGDKFQRAQGVAAAWNDGRVLVPLGSPPWLKAFLEEVDDFTGVNDDHDDQVDWLAHAWNADEDEPADYTGRTTTAPRRI